MPNKSYELSVSNSKDHRNPQSLEQHRRGSADCFETKTLGTVNQNVSENNFANDDNQIHCVIVRDNPGLVQGNAGDRDNNTYQTITVQEVPSPRPDTTPPKKIVSKNDVGTGPVSDYQQNLSNRDLDTPEAYSVKRNMMQRFNNNNDQPYNQQDDVATREAETQKLIEIQKAQEKMKIDLEAQLKDREEMERVAKMKNKLNENRMRTYELVKNGQTLRKIVDVKRKSNVNGKIKQIGFAPGESQQVLEKINPKVGQMNRLRGFTSQDLTSSATGDHKIVISHRSRESRTPEPDESKEENHGTFDTDKMVVLSNTHNEGLNTDNSTKILIRNSIELNRQNQNQINQQQDMNVQGINVGTLVGFNSNNQMEPKVVRTNVRRAPLDGALSSGRQSVSPSLPSSTMHQRLKPSLPIKNVNNGGQYASNAQTFDSMRSSTLSQQSKRYTMPQISHVNLNTSFNKDVPNKAIYPNIGANGRNPTTGRLEEQLLHSSNPSETNVLKQWQEEVQNLGLKSNQSVSFKGEVGIENFPSSTIDRRGGTGDTQVGDTMRNPDITNPGGDYYEIDKTKSRHGLIGKTVDCQILLKQDSSAARFQTEGSVIGDPKSSLFREPRDALKNTPLMNLEEVGATSKLTKVHGSIADTPNTMISPRNTTDRLVPSQHTSGQKKPVPGLLLYNKLNVKMNKGAEQDTHNKFSLLNNVESHLTFGIDGKQDRQSSNPYMPKPAPIEKISTKAKMTHSQTNIQTITSTDFFKTKKPFLGLSHNQTVGDSQKSSNLTIDKFGNPSPYKAHKLGAASQNRSQSQYLLNKSIEFHDDKALNTLGQKQRKLYPVFPQKSSLPPVQFCMKMKSKDVVKNHVQNFRSQDKLIKEVKADDILLQHQKEVATSDSKNKDGKDDIYATYGSGKNPIKSLNFKKQHQDALEEDEREKSAREIIHQFRQYQKTHTQQEIQSGSDYKKLDYKVEDILKRTSVYAFRRSQQQFQPRPSTQMSTESFYKQEEFYQHQSEKMVKLMEKLRAKSDPRILVYPQGQKNDSQRPQTMTPYADLKVKIKTKRQGYHNPHRLASQDLKSVITLSKEEIAMQEQNDSYYGVNETRSMDAELMTGGDYKSNQRQVTQLSNQHQRMQTQSQAFNIRDLQDILAANSGKKNFNSAYKTNQQFYKPAGNFNPPRGGSQMQTRGEKILNWRKEEQIQHTYERETENDVGTRQDSQASPNLVLSTGQKPTLPVLKLGRVTQKTKRSQDDMTTKEVRDIDSEGQSDNHQEMEMELSAIEGLADTLMQTRHALGQTQDRPESYEGFNNSEFQNDELKDQLQDDKIKKLMQEQIKAQKIRMYALQTEAKQFTDVVGHLGDPMQFQKYLENQPKEMGKLILNPKRKLMEERQQQNIAQTTITQSKLQTSNQISLNTILKNFRNSNNNSNFHSTQNNFKSGLPGPQNQDDDKSNESEEVEIKHIEVQSNLEMHQSIEFMNQLHNEIEQSTKRNKGQDLVDVKQKNVQTVNEMTYQDNDNQDITNTNLSHQRSVRRVLLVNQKGQTNSVGRDQEEFSLHNTNYPDESITADGRATSVEMIDKKIGPDTDNIKLEHHFKSQNRSHRDYVGENTLKDVDSMRSSVMETPGIRNNRALEPDLLTEFMPGQLGSSPARSPDQASIVPYVRHNMRSPKIRNRLRIQAVKEIRDRANLDASNVHTDNEECAASITMFDDIHNSSIARDSIQSLVKITKKEKVKPGKGQKYIKRGKFTSQGTRRHSLHQEEKSKAVKMVDQQHTGAQWKEVTKKMSANPLLTNLPENCDRYEIQRKGRPAQTTNQSQHNYYTNQFVENEIEDEQNFSIQQFREYRSIVQSQTQDKK